MTQRKIHKVLKHVSDTREFVVGAGCLSEIPSLWEKRFPGKKALIVADDNTYLAAGKKIFDSLSNAKTLVAESLVFPGKPILSPDYAHVQQLRDLLVESNAVPLAVGSGTISDIAKRASHEASRRYMISATAASMDGYSSFGAALLVDGFKKTLECAAPLVIVADVQVLKDAPPEMTAAGYGDLLGKITAGADWVLSDILETEPIDLFSWRLSQKNLRRWVGRPLKLVLGDPKAFIDLFEGLTMTGFAMQALQSSRPASGSEHLFSHVWEMQHLEKDGVPVSHGFKVALGTLAASAMMQVLLAQDVTPADVEAAVRRRASRRQRESEVRERFKGSGVVEQAVETSLAKHVTGDPLKARLQRASERWDMLRRRVRRQLIPFSELRDMLRAAGCPTQPEQIGMSRKQLEGTFRMAQMIRPRYTVLDLAYDLGRLDECVKLIFSDRRFFGAGEAAA